MRTRQRQGAGLRGVSATVATALLGFAAAVAVVGCSRHRMGLAWGVTTEQQSTHTNGPPPHAAASTNPAATANHRNTNGVDPNHTYAVLINGGGQRQSNFQSHLLHLKGLLPLLQASGIDGSHITIFSGDGSDPAEDLATRDVDQDTRLWLLPNGASRYLRPDIKYVNSTIDGFALQPARTEDLRAWFADQGRQLGPGDTLLFYVTDHGEQNRKDPTNNTITMWKESLSVTELQDLFAQLDPGVHVVTVMSQCFSGAFARTIYTDRAGDEPLGNVCGYFAATAERPAYGCYPENYGKEGIGHSHNLFEALQVLGTLPEAHSRVQVTDRTPDVPHSSSDYYLDQRLRAVASAAHREPDALIDELLAEAWQDRGAWESEIRLLDRIGRTFGCFSPRSLAELHDQSRTLPEFSNQLRTYGERWAAALDALKAENFQEFLVAHPEWRTRLKQRTQPQLDAETRREMSAELLAELEPFTKSNHERYARLLSLKQKTDEALDASYRSEVRLGAVLRMRTVLTRVAGQVYLSERATPAERDAYARLLSCEDVPLGPPPTVASAAALDTPDPFPTLAQERERVAAVMPAWMGVQYRPVPETQRTRYALPKGAAAVMTVFPNSAADTAGLQVGDIVLGPPDAPFTEPHALREWAMRNEVGAPTPLAVRRDAQTFEVNLRPDPFPLKLPELPGPPKVGSNAPPLKVESFRGDDRLVQGQPHLLFFWATWCLPCKFALPEVLAFSQARGTEVIAITDESPDVLERFFHDFHEPFPQVVVIDPLRLTFQGYGVSGTPTFVLVDGQGRVSHYKTGYDAKVGLGIDGWRWKSPAKKAAQRGTGTTL